MNDLFGLLKNTLKGTYEVESVIGEGGFGVVYRGRHRTLDTPVAIKVLKVPTELSEDGQNEVKKKFLEEARTVARLRHPAIVRALDFDASTMPAGQVALWMVLEWVDGRPLADWLAQRGARPVPPREALDLLRPVFDALALAHEKGIAHRDVKPGNIMVLDAAVDTPRTSQPHLPNTQLLDFGIAKAMGPDETDEPSGYTQTSSFLNLFSLHYAAPEQVGGTRTGPWTDVHALALIMTELLTRHRPYPGADKMELSASVLSQTRPTPANKGADVGAWAPVLAKAMACKPGDRYPNARAFLAALEESVPSGVTFAAIPVAQERAPFVTGPSAPELESASGSTSRPSTSPIPVPSVYPADKYKSFAKVVGGVAVVVAFAAALIVLFPRNVPRAPEAPATPHTPVVRDATSSTPRDVRPPADSAADASTMAADAPSPVVHLPGAAFTAHGANDLDAGTGGHHRRGASAPSRQRDREPAGPSTSGGVRL